MFVENWVRRSQFSLYLVKMISEIMSISNFSQEQMQPLFNDDDDVIFGGEDSEADDEFLEEGSVKVARDGHEIPWSKF